MRRALAICHLFAAFAAFETLAADRISVASGVASGSQITVGVFVTDNSGSSLNVNDAPDRRIQSLGFKIDFSPASAVASVSVTRTGVLGGLTPLFESAPSTATSASYIASFSQAIPFTLNGAGDQIANVLITLSPSAVAGSTLTLSLDPNATALSNQGGTIEQTAANGQLTLGNGTISIPVPSFTLTGPASVRFGSDATLTAQLGSAQGSPVTIATSSSSPSVTVPASVTIPAGLTSATFPARGASAGNATVTATLPGSLGGATASLNLSVSVPSISLSLGLALGVGENRSVSVSLDAPAGSSIDVAISSSAPAVVTVPASVRIAAGQTSASFIIGGASAGSSTITAALPAAAGGGTASASIDVIVFTMPSPPSAPQPADGAVDVPAPVFLVWSGGQGAQSYDVYFGTADNPPLLTITTNPGVGAITSPGGKYFWRIVAKNPAGEATSPVWSFTVRTSTGCVTPGVPLVSAPASATTSQNYVVSWSAVSGATEYAVEESGDPNFSVKTTTVVQAPATTATFNHATSTDVTFYYRVRARSVASGCDQSGSFSTIATVIVRGTAGPLLRIIPAVASGQGANSSFFRTSVQLHNTGSAAISGRFVFHPAGRSGSASDPTLNYTLGPRESRSYADLVADMSLSGLGSVDLIGDLGALPRVVVRVFNDGAANGTSGTTQPLINPEDALGPGSTGVLIGPVDSKASRFNIGVRTLSEGAVITFNVISRTGAQMKSVTREYPATFFEQRNSSEVLETVLGDSDVIEIKVVSGRAIVYGATTDNVTQDPSLQVETRQR